MALQLRRGTNAERLGMTPANGELIFVTDYELVTTSVTSIDTGTDTLTTTAAHGLSVNQQVKYIGATLNGLTANQVYYVKTAPTITSFTLSTSLGGGTLNITGSFTIDLLFAKTPTTASGAPVGTGVSALWIGDGVTVGGVIAASLNLDDLLDVEITSVAEGNTLYYDATTGFWRNTNIVTVDDVNSRVGINNPTPTQTLDVSGNGQFSGAIYGNNTDQATTTSTGSIQTLGGIGVVKNAFIGGAIYGNNTDNATTASTGGIQTLGGIGVAKAVYAGGKITTADSTQSTTPSTGALIVGGGAGIGSNLSVGGAIYGNNTDQATTTSTGSIQTLGGIGVTKNAFIGGSAYVNNTDNATTTTTGSIQTLGGVGVVKDIFVGGDLTVDGGNINLNGTATTATMPFLTFSTQADGANPLYGIRGMSTADDPWFVGAGSTGDDAGYLEIATGDNTGGSNNGGQIYVRQYNGAGAGGAPWYGGSGTIQNELILLDNVGNTSIPNSLTMGGAIIVNNTTDATSQSTGSIVTAGGVGIAKKLHVGSNISVDSTTNATSGTTGSIQTDGGVGIAQDLFVGGIGTITGDVAVNGGDLTTTAATGNLFNTTATTVNIGGAATTMSIGNSAGTVTIPGNLTVSGTTTNINTTNLLVEDKNITIGDVATPTDVTASGGGITLLGATDKTITWNNATDGWEFNQPVKVTGNIVTSGDIAVNGGDVTTTSTTGTLFNTTATTVNIAGAGTTVSIGADTGTTTINNDLVADGLTVSGDLAVNGGDITTTAATASVFNTTATTVNIGGAATTVAIGAATGTTTVKNSLQVDGNTTLGSNSSDTIAAVGLITGDITFGDNSTTTIRGITGTVGATDYWKFGGGANGSDQGYAVIATGDNGDEPIYVQQYTGASATSTLTLLDASHNTILPGTLDVQGGTITDSTGALSITTGASNGAITLDPNGTGNVVCTFSNGGNLTNDRNYVFGAIRNATTQSNGDIWVLDADSGGAGTLPIRGISIDNSTDYATKNAGAVLRNYSNNAGFSPRLVLERSRYTGTPATPLTLSSGDTIGSIAATGYSSTLGWINDTLAFAPMVINLTTAEAWVSNTNLGTTFTVSAAPTATTITTVANLVPVIAANPQTFASRSDAFTWANGKTGTTQTMALDVSGNLVVTGDVRINGNNIQGSGGSNAIDLSSANTLTTIRANTTLFNTAADATYASINATGSEFTCSGITNFIRTGTSNGVFPSFLARYKRTDTTGSNDGDGAQILLSTGGTSTTNNIARFDATYRTSGNNEFRIAVSPDGFTTTNATYNATREKTELLATPAGGGTSTVIMEVTDANILNKRAHRNAITTGTVARGGDYAVPATANGSISLTITAGSGITHIDVDAVAADAATGGMYSILIYNNSGNNNIDVQVRNNGVNIGVASNLDIGDRAMASVYIVGDYAACEIMDAA